MYGYAGKILRVNLTTGNIAAEPLAEEMARDYIGGRGFAANILYREIPPGADPLSPENKVVVAAGPLSGLFLPGSGKITFASKSPATGGYGDSNMGGHMASELKFAGYDAIIIEGAAQKPSYLYIDDDEVEIRDASKYWGKGAMISERMILDDLSEDFRVATIGPAGENLVKYACVSHDFGRQSGRTGIAAVLGSKKVKAIAIRGSQTIPVPDPAKLFEVGGRMYENCFAKPGFKEWTPDGTAGVTDWANQIGAFPTRNFWTGYFEAHKNINGQALSNRIKVLDKGCFGCPIPCGKYSKVEMDGKSVNVEGPEYESIALLGGNLMLDSIEKVAYANYVCDELGLDTISAGNVIAFAMECLEKGVITKEQVGQELRWGSL
ncbi:MAG TPA: aldehyde ferredoxin oxidoreductase, partial [Firmicutes bacterium]|nr:aldehyde ferredoxin oxidoreductase [Bacillota bacterium]